MKRTKYHNYTYAPLLFLMLAWIAYGCTDENIYQHSGSKDTELTFSVSLPAKPSTYAIGEDDENNVGHIYVLAFAKSDGTYKLSDWSEGSSIQNNGSNSKKKFTLKFTRLQQGGSYTFALLANAEKEVNALFSNEGLTAGAEKNATLARLQLSGVTQWNTNPSDKGYRNIPMWGETAGDVTVNPDMTISDLKLLRMLARINVTVDGSGEPPATDHFVLESVSLYNPYPTGRIVPDAGNLVSGSVSEVNKPTLVKDSKVVTGPVDYEVTDGATLKNTIYTFESAVPYQDGIALADQMTCLIIGGKYGGEDKTTYYRINLTDKNKKYLDILRNHTYGVNITKVKGSGYESKEEAFKAKAVNMEAEIVEWNDGEVSEIIDNGQYILSIYPGNNINFFKDADSRTVQIKTDYPDGWKITRITEADGTTANSGWLTINKNIGDLQGSDGSTVNLTVSVTENSTEAERTGFVYIQFGRTITRLTVTQSIIARLGITARVNGNPVTELLFPATTSQTQELVLEWFPKNADLQITNTTIGSNAFPTTSGIPLSSTIIGGNSGTGKKAYTISTSPFTTTEITNYPFMEKTSKLDLMCSNGANYTIASVLVRQVNFNLIPVKNSYYLLNGNQYTFLVKSNANWRIKTITDNNNLLKTEGTNDNLKKGFVGGGNTDPGTAITFTTKAVNSIAPVSEDIIVVFENIDTPKKFDDVPVTLTLKNGFYPSANGGWAGSNIYWDASTGKFTFDDVGVTTHSLYQGLAFKWGSLYGISLNGATISSNTVIFTPNINGKTTMGTRGWNDIPYVASTTGSSKTRAYLYEVTDYAAGIGDICKWMTEKGWAPAGKKWRMPTSAEFDQNYSYKKGTDKSGVADNGTDQVASYFNVGTISLPLSGYRLTTGSILASTSKNSAVAYWSASPIGSDSVYGLFLGYDASPWINSAISNKTTYACPVRCVVDKD